MDVTKLRTAAKKIPRTSILNVFACTGSILLGCVLRRLGLVFHPVLWDSAQTICAFLGFTIGANVLVRFHGTEDRFSLLLGAGFGLGALIQLGSIAELHHQLSTPASQVQIPVSSMVGSTLLAALLLGANAADRRLTWPRDAKKTVVCAISLVSVATLLLAATFFAFPAKPAIIASGLVPRPWELLPALLFLNAALVLSRSANRGRSAFDATLPWLAAAHCGCHLILSQSTQMLDAPEMGALALETTSFMVLLAATLSDNVRLFGQVRERASTDSLTHLANYRRFTETLLSELERSGRTGRAFSLLLMDLDGLKLINDVHGHLTGTRAICRVADVLRQNCRIGDTAARYGGDEFALLLPETSRTAAALVAERIRKYLAADSESPGISVSIGIATHPADGASVRDLLATADERLYADKSKTTSGRLPRRP